MSVDISVNITEDIVDIIATPTVNIVNVTNSASIDPSLYDLSEFTNTSVNPFVRTSGLSSYVPTTRTLTINGTTQDLSADRTFTISTGITIGTTAITSGTVGRVLFQGTGNVVSQSANLFWDNTNGTLETTTTADNLFGLRLISTTGQLRVKPYLNPTYGVLLESKTANASANLPLTLSGSRLLLADGNVLINTTTDAGFKLDVNGTARVSGLLSLTDNNGIQFTTGFGNNAGNMISSQGSSTLLVMNRGSRVLKFWNGGSQADQSIQIGFGIDALAPSNVASSILQIDSTTKGFLPPRMTTTQINAIASPAEGLQVYNTTISHMCFYQSGSWVRINHSPM